MVEQGERHSYLTRSSHSTRNWIHPIGEQSEYYSSPIRPSHSKGLGHLVGEQGEHSYPLVQVIEDSISKWTWINLTGERGEYPRT